MNARQRINQYYATISILLASGIGLAANSWIVFGCAAAILIGLHLFGGAIRIGRGQRLRSDDDRRSGDLATPQTEAE